MNPTTITIAGVSFVSLVCLIIALRLLMQLPSIAPSIRRWLRLDRVASSPPHRPAVPSFYHVIASAATPHDPSALPRRSRSWRSSQWPTQTRDRAASNLSAEGKATPLDFCIDFETDGFVAVSIDSKRGSLQRQEATGLVMLDTAQATFWPSPGKPALLRGTRQERVVRNGKRSAKRTRACGGEDVEEQTWRKGTRPPTLWEGIELRASSPVDTLSNRVEHARI